MDFTKPHYLLFCDAHVHNSAASDTEPVGGRWHFVLERIDAAERLEASDGERSQPRDRLSLLAVVRGLEALEQPSQVTLVTTSRYVSRGLRYGLSEWREVNYSWEAFGMKTPIRNADLWQRVDGALGFHEVACRLLESSLARYEPPTEELEVSMPRVEAPSVIPAPHFKPRAAASVRHIPRPNHPSETAWNKLATGWMHWLRGKAGSRNALASTPF